MLIPHRNRLIHRRKQSPRNSAHTGHPGSAHSGHKGRRHQALPADCRHTSRRTDPHRPPLQLAISLLRPFVPPLRRFVAPSLRPFSAPLDSLLAIRYSPYPFVPSSLPLRASVPSCLLALFPSYLPAPPSFPLRRSVASSPYLLRPRNRQSDGKNFERILGRPPENRVFGPVATCSRRRARRESAMTFLDRRMPADRAAIVAASEPPGGRRAPGRRSPTVRRPRPIRAPRENHACFT